MDAIRPHEFGKVVFGYQQVENALAVAFGVTVASRPALRGRIQHLRRLGLTPRSGRGKVIRYDFGWAARWYLALLLTMRLGRDPRVAVQVLRRGENFGEVFKQAMKADRAENHVVATINSSRQGPLIFGFASMSMPLGSLLNGFDTVVTAIDLTASLRRLAGALTAEVGVEEGRPVKKQLSGASGRARRRAQN
jgi:hypothetical protein